MPLELPKIYPITDVSLSGRTHAEQVAELIDGGARFIQIREKDASPDDFYAAVVECVGIAKATATVIIVNDRVDIALAARAHGVHLGQTDLPAAKARELLGDEAVIGISTHNLEQAEDALRLPVDYVAFGPVWPTRTKKNPDPTVGLGPLRELKEIAGDLPLVAIGGINAENLPATLGAGADCAAIISELYRDGGSITNRFRHLRVVADVKHG